MKQPEAEDGMQQGPVAPERRPYLAPQIQDFLEKPVVLFDTGVGDRGTRRPPRE